MVENLKMIMENAYTPYSNFQVACIIKMKNNQEFIGVNVENASFKSGLCAEQVAIAGAVADGYSKADFKELHVMGSSKAFSYPCFLCRQLLLEFFDPASAVYCYNEHGKCQKLSVADLCTYAFDYEEVTNG